MRTGNGSNGSQASGFTLIELMIVVAIIGILAAIAIPKFADLVQSSEGASKGNVGSIRSALAIYYGDTSTVEEQIGSEDNMGWMYNNFATDANFGAIWVNCTHTDTKGTTWTAC